MIKMFGDVFVTKVVTGRINDNGTYKIQMTLCMLFDYLYFLTPDYGNLTLIMLGCIVNFVIVSDLSS